MVAYFSLCPHEVLRESLPSGVGHGSPRVIPAILLAKLALDTGLHGQGLGAQLLVDALSRAVKAVDAAGGRLIVVDAIDEEAARFYEHHGFDRVPGESLRLVMKASSARVSIESASNVSAQAPHDSG